MKATQGMYRAARGAKTPRKTTKNNQYLKVGSHSNIFQALLTVLLSPVCSYYTSDAKVKPDEIAFSLFTLTFFSLAHGSFVSEANKLETNKIKYDGLPEIVSNLAGK